jgi:hypothetical protein
MKRSAPKTRWNLIVVLLVACVLTYAGFRYLYPVQSADIFVITPTQLEYGETTVTGVISKDTATGEQGNYLLVLPDGRPIALTMDGLDRFVGSRVTIAGTLLPAVGDSIPLNMTVDSITAN